MSPVSPGYIGRLPGLACKPRSAPWPARRDLMGGKRSPRREPSRRKWMIRYQRQSRTRLALAHFIFAFTFFRSAQYFFIRSDTALRAAADIRERLRRPCFFAGLGSAFQ